MDNSILDVFDRRFEYHELLWGDLIYGTEAQLRALGLSCDFSSLSNRRGARRSAIDPRGFACKVERACYKGAEVFSVSIPFPGREQPCLAWEDSGISGILVRRTDWTDDYIGNREALVLAGLVPEGCFPGDPGMRKVRVTIFADGTLPSTPPTKNLPVGLAKAPGARNISRAGVRRFEVSVYLAPEFATARHEADLRNQRAWEAAMQALPRPPRLDACLRELRDQAVRNRRAQMRVVWSRPAWVPGFNLTM